MKTAVFIDGTGCSQGSGTNIERLADAVDFTKEQEAVYCSGPGTRLGSIILGKVFGNDVGDIVLSCAKHLHFSIRERGTDELYLFGFSRGAFAARLLADFAAHGALSLHPRRMAAAWRSYVAAANDRVPSPQFTMSPVPPIRFLGVFDSVDSVPTIRSAHLERLPSAVSAARHAVAIDEHRPLFDYLPFAKDPRVEEVFFPGSHSDIGGGYDDNREIADLTLRWMADAAAAAGLAFGKGAIPAKAFNPANAAIHDSSHDASNAFGLPPKFMRKIDPARVHPSAAEIAKAQEQAIVDRIAIVAAVRDFAFYRKCVEDNPMLEGCEKTAFDNSSENLPVPARYNSFLDSFDYSRPAWIVFCHEDWQAKEPIAPVLSRLDPGSVYGVAGATVERRAFFLARWKFAGDIESCNRDGSDPGVHGLPAPPGTLCDTVDCVCLIVHSSLVQRHSLRFDPEMTFDLYAEDFCIAARERHGIAVRLVPFACRHWSGGCAGERYRTLRKKLQKKWRGAKGCSSTVSPYLCGRAQWWWRLWAAIRPAVNFVRGRR